MAGRGGGVWGGGGGLGYGFVRLNGVSGWVGGARCCFLILL